MVRVVSISGSIGVGKSTLVSGLAVQPPQSVRGSGTRRRVVFSPTLLLEDRCGYASLHSRLEFLLVKARQLASMQERSTTPPFSTGRSPELITFARALLAMGAMPQHDFDLYEGIYHLVIREDKAH